jgi:hypothetical protein
VAAPLSERSILEHKAAEAWALLTRADDPMPPYVARDWLMEQADCDREAAVEALSAVAVKWLRAVPVPQEEGSLTSRAESVCAALAGGRLLGAAGLLREIRGSVEPQFLHPISLTSSSVREWRERVTREWAPWIAAAALAVRLVREFSEGT